MSETKHNHAGIGEFSEALQTAKYCPRCRLNAAADDLLETCEKVVNWLDKLTIHAQKQAKACGFESLADAYISDAKNYTATANDLRKVIAKAKGK